MFNCPYCDALLTRAARLALHLRKVAVLRHAQLGHPGDAPHCLHDPCRRTFQLLTDNVVDAEATERQQCA